MYEIWIIAKRRRSWIPVVEMSYLCMVAEPPSGMGGGAPSSVETSQESHCDVKWKEVSWSGLVPASGGFLGKSCLQETSGSTQNSPKRVYKIPPGLGTPCDLPVMLPGKGFPSLSLYRSYKLITDRCQPVVPFVLLFLTQIFFSFHITLLIVVLKMYF